MKKAVVIGGKGKVGTYLVPGLWEMGYEVINVSRGESLPFLPHGCWEDTRQVKLDRKQPDFEARIAELGADVVLDMICFKNSDMQKLAAALKGRVQHYLVTGSVWMHGAAEVTPYTEDMCRTPFCEYGRQKLAMDEEIARLYAMEQFPGTIVHPGHIVGPGHMPVNPQGNRNPAVFTALRRGEELVLPNMGMETLGHVHAEDVAGVFLAALKAGSVSYGQGFHATAGRAITLRGYARAVAGWYGKEANLRYMPFEDWAKTVSEADAAATLDHIAHSPNASMEKAQRMLGFTPRWSSLQAVRESLNWLVENGEVE